MEKDGGDVWKEMLVFVNLGDSMILASSEAQLGRLLLLYFAGIYTVAPPHIPSFLPDISVLSTTLNST